MVVNGQYDIVNITDRSSINTAVNRTERPAAPSRVAGDNGFENNLKPSTYRAGMVNNIQESSRQGDSSQQSAGNQEIKNNVYTREQVFEKRASSETGQQGAGSRDVKTSSGTEDSASRLRVERQVQELKSAEQEVIAHEQAHMSVGGQYTGTATYSYTEGPDGKRYITGGEVPIYAAEGKDAEETARIMNQVRRAALAPANPSSQDMKVASRAASAEQAALREQAIDQSMQSSQALRQEIQASAKEKLATDKTDEDSGAKVQDVIDQQNARRLNRQARLAENQVAAEQRNLDAVALEQKSVQQDYQRKVMAYQRIMEQVSNIKSNISPVNRSVNLVA